MRILAALFVALFLAPAAFGAVSSYDERGTVLIDGAKAFPLGLSGAPPFDVPTPDGGDPLTEIHDAGIRVIRVMPPVLWVNEKRQAVSWLTQGNAIDGASLDFAETWLRQAEGHGLYAWLGLNALSYAEQGSVEEAALNQIVDRFRADPALLFWKTADEPWWGGWPADTISYGYSRLKELDPSHSTIIIQAPKGTTADLAPYADVTDHMGVDVYPVAYKVRAAADLHRVGLYVRTVRKASPNHSVFATLQICSSASDDPRGSGAYVLPTRRQERYMIYDAILNGAKGLFFFGGQAKMCLPPGSPDSAYGWQWTFWNGVLKNLLGEIKEGSDFYPALLEPSGPRIRVNRRNMQVTSRVAGDMWVIAARHGRVKTVTLSGLPAGATEAEVYGEGRTVAVRNGRLADRFRRWSVHVYRIRSQ